MSWLAQFFEKLIFELLLGMKASKIDLKIRLTSKFCKLTAKEIYELQITVQVIFFTIGININIIVLEGARTNYLLL